MMFFINIIDKDKGVPLGLLGTVSGESCQWACDVLTLLIRCAFSLI